MSLINGSTLPTTQKNKHLKHIAAEAWNLANKLHIITSHILMPTLILPLYLLPCFSKSPLISKLPNKLGIYYLSLSFMSYAMPILSTSTRVSWAPSLCSFLQPLHFIPLRSKYSPQHQILRFTQPIFFPQVDRLSFTAAWNNKWNYRFLCTCIKETER